MSGKKTFDMVEIKERLNEEQYEKDKAKGFKVTTGEKIVHIVVAIIAFLMFLSFLTSYGLSPVPHYSIAFLLFVILMARVVQVLKMKVRKH